MKLNDEENAAVYNAVTDLRLLQEHGEPSGAELGLAKAWFCRVKGLLETLREKADAKDIAEREEHILSVLEGVYSVVMEAKAFLDIRDQQVLPIPRPEVLEEIVEKLKNAAMLGNMGLEGDLGFGYPDAGFEPPSPPTEGRRRF